jgi:hypothetical protein
MKLFIVAVGLMLGGCFAVQVQETTLHNDSGGTMVCKQTGQGLISYSVGKSHYDDCIQSAHAQGYK